MSSLSQQRHHHLGICQRCSIFLACWGLAESQTQGRRFSSVCFNKFGGWFWCMLRIESHWLRLFKTSVESVRGLPWGLSSKESTCWCRSHGFDSWVRKMPWRRAWQPTPVDCLEHPMNRGAWWAIIHRVTKYRIQLSDYTATIRFNQTEFWHSCVTIRKSCHLSELLSTIAKCG